MSKPANFDNNVFINCPFDSDYNRVLRALLFTVIYCEFEPRIATERADSGQPRIVKIYELILESRFSIHDLSRMDRGKLPRFNMPLELGLDLGSRHAGAPHLATKECLVLVNKRHGQYEKVISDLSGNDPVEHLLDVDRTISAVRNWLIGKVDKSLQSGSYIAGEYWAFDADLPDLTRDTGHNPDELKNMETVELIRYMKRWRTDRVVP